MELSARDVLQQRITTLQSLLASPSGPFGAQAGALALELAQRWKQELRLIDRILDDTPEGQSVLRTLDLWFDRTEAFAQASSAEEPGWTDRQGQAWKAKEVLELLEDLRDRLSSWRKQEVAAPPAGASPPAAAATSTTPATGSAGPQSEGS